MAVAFFLVCNLPGASPGHKQPTAVARPQSPNINLEHMKCDVVGVGVAWVASSFHSVSASIPVPILL